MDPSIGNFGQAEVVEADAANVVVGGPMEEEMGVAEAPCLQPLDSIAVSLFGWSKQIQHKSSPNSIRRQDPNNYSDTEMRALSMFIMRMNASTF